MVKGRGNGEGNRNAHQQGESSDSLPIQLLRFPVLTWFYFRILVWEDGFCDFYECERAKREYVKINFGPEIFFKMSHEVYSFGEG